LTLPAPFFTVATMSDNKDRPRNQQNDELNPLARKGEVNARADALRDNLLKRKQQNRNRKEEEQK